MSWPIGIPLLFALMLLISSESGHAQEVPPSELPGAFDVLIEQMQFYTPTRIEGRLLTLDTYDNAIWIEWIQFYNGRRWLLVPPEVQFIVYPRDPGMMEFFRTLKPGTILRMTIQSDHDGKRRILELEGT